MNYYVVMLMPTIYIVYEAQIILDSPNHYGRVSIVLYKSNLFWSGPKHFGQAQKNSPEKSN